MKTINRRLKASLSVVSALALAASLAACGGSNSAGDGDGGGPSVTMSLGHVFPDGSAIDNAADAFAANVKKKTDGKVTINVFPGGQIGSDEEMATALNSGTQEAAILSVGSSGFGDRVQLQNIPYIVSSFDEADKVYYGDGFMAKWDRETMEKNGIHGLEFVENGFRGLSNSKHKVELPADVAGLKVRAPSSDLIIDIFANWKSKAVAIPFPELYTALEQGTVDGQENGVTLFNDSKLYEVQKYYTDTRYTYATALFVVSKSVWDGLSADQQKILDDESVAASLEQRKQVRAQSESALEDLKGKIDVTVPTAEQFVAWRESVKPIWDDARKKFGADAFDKLMAAAEAAQS